jgi:3D-(3,5/4)-trihydroxycyclohexane-1,2-dione acylhydrolase (decyclizing)
MFEPRLHRVPRPRPDARSLDEATDLLRRARRPLLVLGGGVRYSGAAAAAVAVAEAHGIPVVDTPAGRTMIAHNHRLYGGPLGIIGSASGNALASDADVVLAVGTRLQDFATASWTVFAPDMRLVSLNAARFDAVKHAGHAVVGDARSGLEDLDALLAGWRVDPAWTARAATERAGWDAHVDRLREGVAPDGSLTYAEVVGTVNAATGADDYVLASSGGMPGELHGGWRAVAPDRSGPTSGATMDLEYGFSCMGYELSGAWGAAIAHNRTHPGGLVTTLLGDGSYLMLNADLYSAAFAGHPFVAVVCDNAGYAVIHRLQTGQGAAGFNNLLADAAGPGATAAPVRVDFAAHARSLGCTVEVVPADGGRADLETGYAQARATARRTGRPAVVVCRVHPTTWTEAGAWWEVGVPETLPGRAAYDRSKARQLRWIGSRDAGAGDDR